MPPLEGRQLLHLALERAPEGPGEREQPLDVLLREVGDRDQVPALEAPRREELVAEQWTDLSHRSFLSRARG